MTNAPLALGVIPARAHSSRFPFKIIHPVLGKPLVQYIWENALGSTIFSRVLVATDHPDIAKVVKEFGGEAVLTPEFNSGSDRVAFIAKDAREDFIVNLQGDEPLLRSKDIRRLVQSLQTKPNWDIATLGVKGSGDWSQNPNLVKLFRNERNEAMDFSRKPFGTDYPFVLKHIGIYGYRREALLKFCKLPMSEREQDQKLEQLRALDNGMKIGVVEIEKDTVAVDVPEDILIAEKRLKEESLT